MWQFQRMEDDGCGLRLQIQGEKVSNHWDSGLQAPLMFTKPHQRPTVQLLNIYIYSI